MGLSLVSFLRNAGEMPCTVVTVEFNMMSRGKSYRLAVNIHYGFCAELLRYAKQPLRFTQFSMMTSTTTIVVCAILALTVAAVILAVAVSPDKAREALLAFVRQARVVLRRVDERFRRLLERLLSPSPRQSQGSRQDWARSVAERMIAISQWLTAGVMVLTVLCYVWSILRIELLKDTLSKFSEFVDVYVSPMKQSPNHAIPRC